MIPGAEMYFCFATGFGVPFGEPVLVPGESGFSLEEFSFYVSAEDDAGEEVGAVAEVSEGDERFALR